MKEIELTPGQISSLAQTFEEELNEEIKIDRIVILRDKIQVFYNDGNPKVKDISIYD